jgi:O-antigen/teichoic acid export membrane protein
MISTEDIHTDSIHREGFAKKAVSGGFWSFSLRIANRLLTLIRTLVLARLLSPDDFGLFGIAMLALAAMENVSTTGFDQALIQKSGNIEHHLDTAWVVQIIRGLLLGLILYFGAPFIARFFDEPNAFMLMRVLGIGVFVAGLRNPGVVYFRKELDFRKDFIYEFSGAIADFGVAITAALILRNAWALVFGFLARSVLQVVASYIIQNYRPRFAIRKDSFRALFSFGMWVWVSGIIVFLVTQGDDVVVGKVLGVTALGFYQMAFKISNMSATEMTQTISRVAFPTYSKIKDDIDRLKSGFLRTLRLMMILSVPVMLLVIGLVEDFVGVFIGEKWQPIVLPAKILAISGLLRSIVSSCGPLFIALGKPKQDSYLNFMRLAVMAITVYPLTVSHGITGAAISALLGLVATLPYYFYRLSKDINVSLKEFTAVSGPSLVSGLGAVAVFSFLRTYLPGATIAGVVFNGFFIVAIFVLALFTIDKLFHLDYFREVKTIFGRFGGRNAK